MGQAKLRGTRDQRVAQAIARKSAIGVDKYAANHINQQATGRRKPMLMAFAMIAAAVSAVMPTIARRYLGL